MIMVQCGVSLYFPLGFAHSTGTAQIGYMYIYMCVLGSLYQSSVVVPSLFHHFSSTSLSCLHYALLVCDRSPHPSLSLVALLVQRSSVPHNYTLFHGRGL